MTGPVTGDGHSTGSRTRVTANGHTGPLDGQTNMSAIVETVDGHSESASDLDGTGSGPKTVTGTAETAHGQKGSVKNPGKSARVHETAKVRGVKARFARPVKRPPRLRTGTTTLYTRISTSRGRRS